MNVLAALKNYWLLNRCDKLLSFEFWMNLTKFIKISHIEMKWSCEKNQLGYAFKWISTVPEHIYDLIWIRYDTIRYDELRWISFSKCPNHLITLNCQPHGFTRDEVKIVMPIPQFYIQLLYKLHPWLGVPFELDTVFCQITYQINYKQKMQFFVACRI